MLKTNHFIAAQESYQHAIEGVRLYCTLCEQFDWTHAALVRDSLFLYLEESLDEIAHANEMVEREDA